MKRCKTCEIISEICGKRLLYRIFYKNKRVTKEQILPLAKDLKIKVVGGLVRRGWTLHDIDVVGNRQDVAIFSRRLRKNQISNPIHFCGRTSEKHSHLRCLWNGLMLILRGNKY